MTRNLLTLIGKELRSLFADPILLILITYMFTGMVIAMSQSNTDIRNAAVAIIDEDHSPLSRRLADAIRPPYFRTPAAIDRSEADAAMNRGDYVFILEIPPHFERDLLQGRSPEILNNIDATRMNQGGIGSAYLAQILAQETRETLKQSAPAPLVNPVIRTRYNPNAENAYQMPVTALGNAILLLLLLLVGAAVIREREHGTIEHLLVMPVTASEIMLAKILANGLVILVASTLSLLGVPINGTLTNHLLGAATYLFSIASLAIMIATLTPSLQQYSLLMLPLFIIMNLFSGATTSRSNMPELARAISEYWPSTQYAIYNQSIIFRGADLHELWPQLLNMGATGLLFLGLALVRFRKMLETQG